MTYTIHLSKRKAEGDEAENDVFECDGDFGRKVATLQRIAAKLADTETAGDLLATAHANAAAAESDGA